MNFDQFQKKLNQLQANVRQELFESLAKELAAKLLAEAIPHTPTGRKPTLEQLGGKGAKKTVKTKLRDADGKLRTRSFLTKEGAILQQYWSGYVGGTLKRGWTAKPVERFGNQYRITVINSVEYASYVEFGHRQKPGRYVPQIGKRLKRGWVPGQYMLTNAEKELQEWAKTHMAKRFNAYLQKALKE